MGVLRFEKELRTFFSLWRIGHGRFSRSLLSLSDRLVRWGTGRRVGTGDKDYVYLARLRYI